MPAVSIITPAYNVARFIAGTIESVQAQTVQDFELIVVDDGSTDDTYNVVARYAYRDPRIAIVRQPNSGISAARNRALRTADGSAMAILDGDDVWLPGYLERQLAILEAHPEVDIVTGNGWFLEGPFDGQPARPWPDRRRVPTLARILRDETAVFIMSVFRRRVYDLIGGFDESLRTNEDYDFWIRAAAAGCRFWRNDEPLGHYRRRNDSLSAGELRMLNGIIRVLQKNRPALLHRPKELAVLDAQLARFETECLAAQARDAIERRSFDVAADCLARLHRRRGGAALGLARVMARWTPGLLSRAYSMRRARLETVASRQRATAS
jgi:glycosyltransferase involved in cell wall biosynthesis